MKDYIAQVFALVRKDLLLELRARDQIGAMFVFAVLTVLIFSFALDLRAAPPGAAGAPTSSTSLLADNAAELAIGVVWVALIFAGILGLGRTFALEKERGAIEGLLLCPADRSVIYVAKVLANLITLFLVEAAVLPLALAFFNINLLRPDTLLVVALGSIGFVAIGTLFAAISANTRAREVLLPILLLPLIVPVVLGAVRASEQFLGIGLIDDRAPWLSLLAAYDVIFLVIPIAVFDHVLEE